MNTLPLAIMIIVQGSILAITIYLYWKVYKIENNKEDDGSNNFDEQYKSNIHE